MWPFPKEGLQVYLCRQLRNALRRISNKIQAREALKMPNDINTYQLYSSPILQVRPEVIPKSGYLRSGQTNYDSGTGFWLGNDDGTAKFSIGNSAGNKLTWNGSTLAITGTITATTGTIGGWTIGATTLTGGNATLNSTGILNLGTGTD